MGKIVMPKNSALLTEVEAVLKIYYEEGNWLSNDEYKARLKKIIGDDQYSSSYTKKAQITSYFGFTEWQDINNVRSLRRITDSGKRFYEHLLNNNKEMIIEDLMLSLENTTFGRNNYGCPDSNSDVEPPVVFVRAILDLGYLTYKEFAYLLWKLEDVGGNYTDGIQDIRVGRSQYSFDIPNEATKYTDAKPIMVLVRWGFLEEDDSDNSSKHIVIPADIKNKYLDRIRNLKIYNIDKNVFKYKATVFEEDNQKQYQITIDNKYKDLSEDEIVKELSMILLQMCASGTNKTTAIHIFGLKYADIIKKHINSRLKKQEIITNAGIKKSLVEELDKGIRIYEAILNNEYGVSFYQKDDKTHYISNIYLVKKKKKKYSLNSILYGAPGTGKTYATAQYALAIIENKDVEDISKEDRATVMSRYNKMVDEGRIVFTTFHQNYGYEDFIQGIRPDTSSKGMGFKTVDGVFKVIADKAIKDGDNNYVIIIDEINRANISKVFGELITLIEEDKRWGEENAISVTLPSGEPFAIPNNLYIIGTMNSADKSISLIDTALRRRFTFIEFVPNLDLIEDDKLKKVLEKLNNGIVSELNSTDLLVGHSFFMNKTADDMCDIMNHNIIPLLYEYFFDNQKKVEAQITKAIEGMDVEIKHSPMGRIKLVKKEANK